ncbi:MAG: hypothetical protein GX592_01755 [Clostridiales bacterium]|nr:hypothetical protein [Clostridiales bacterium]
MSENFDRGENEGNRAEEPAEVTAVKFPKLDPSDFPPEQMEDVPLLEEDTPLDKGWLYNFVLKMDDVQFRRAQTIFGLILGLVAATVLFIPIGQKEDGNSSMWNMAIALVIALPLPRFIERKIEKRIPQAQKIMAISMGVGLAAYALFMFLSGRFGQSA